MVQAPRRLLWLPNFLLLLLLFSFLTILHVCGRIKTRSTVFLGTDCHFPSVQHFQLPPLLFFSLHYPPKPAFAFGGLIKSILRLTGYGYGRLRDSGKEHAGHMKRTGCACTDSLSVDSSVVTFKLSKLGPLFWEFKIAFALQYGSCLDVTWEWARPK